jgi:hypothetical protein
MVTLDHWSDPGLLVGYVIVVVFANANDVGTGKVSDPESLSFYVGFDTPG